MFSLRSKRLQSSYSAKFFCSRSSFLDELARNRLLRRLAMLTVFDRIQIPEAQNRHQNGMGKRVTLSLIYDKCMQPGSRNRDKLMH